MAAPSHVLLTNPAHPPARGSSHAAPHRHPLRPRCRHPHVQGHTNHRSVTHRHRQPDPAVEGDFRIEGFELLVLSVPFTENPRSRRAPDRLDRVYRDANGNIQVEVLLTGEEIGGFLLINSVVTSPDDQQIVAATCRGENCGAFGPTYKDATTVLHRSTDGGRNWTHYGEIDGITRPLWNHGGILVTVLTPIAGVSDRVDWLLRRFPSGVAIEVPEHAVPRGRSPTIDPMTGDLRWRSADGRGGQAERDIPRNRQHPHERIRYLEQQRPAPELDRASHFQAATRCSLRRRRHPTHPVLHRLPCLLQPPDRRRPCPRPLGIPASRGNRGLRR